RGPRAGFRRRAATVPSRPARTGRTRRRPTAGSAAPRPAVPSSTRPPRSQQPPPDQTGGDERDRERQRGEAPGEARPEGTGLQRRAGRTRSSRPSTSHSRPTPTDARRLASSRARTTTGRSGKATAVAVSTIGLIAGAESRKASAAAGVTPAATSRLATGTEP